MSKSIYMKYFVKLSASRFKLYFLGPSLTQPSVKSWNGSEVQVMSQPQMYALCTRSRLILGLFNDTPLTTKVLYVKWDMKMKLSGEMWKVLEQVVIVYLKGCEESTVHTNIVHWYDLLQGDDKRTRNHALRDVRVHLDYSRYYPVASNSSWWHQQICRLPATLQCSLLSQRTVVDIVLPRNGHKEFGHGLKAA